MLGSKVISLLALDVHDPDQPVLDNQRNRQLRTHAGIHLDILVRSGDVVEQYRLPSERHLPDHPLTHGNAQPLDMRGVAYLEPDAQFMGAVVQQENGEDAVGNDGAYQFRCPAEQGFEVERGIQRIGKLHQIGYIHRFDADIGRVEMHPGAGRVSRTVVAFKLRFFTRRWWSGFHGCRRE